MERFKGGLAKRIFFILKQFYLRFTDKAYKRICVGRARLLLFV